MAKRKTIKRVNYKELAAKHESEVNSLLNQLEGYQYKFRASLDAKDETIEQLAYKLSKYPALEKVKYWEQTNAKLFEEVDKLAKENKKLKMVMPIDFGHSVKIPTPDNHFFDSLRYSLGQMAGCETKKDAPAWKHGSDTGGVTEHGNEPIFKKSDPVNHPSHYTDGKIEVIQFINDKKLNFELGNAVKYICRAGKKDKTKTIEDLEKAIWYIKHEIEELNKRTN